MALFDLSRWPGIVVFVFAGATAVAFAFITANLFSQAMANLNFIQRHGLVAIQEGALVQLAQLIFWGILALLTFLAFKACEVELLYRYHDWTDRRRAGRDDGGDDTPDAAQRRRMFRLRRR